MTNLKPELSVLGTATNLVLRDNGKKINPGGDNQCEVNEFNCSVSESDE